MEIQAEKWVCKTEKRAQDGGLDLKIATHLFDHTWKVSANQIGEKLNLRSGMRIMEAGCGWGRLVHAVKYFHPDIEIDGYELVAELAATARRLLDRENLSASTNIIEGDLLEIEIPKNYYDALYSSRVIHYIQDKQTVVTKLYDCLKPGGKALIILPNSLCPYRWLTYERGLLYPIRGVGRIMREVGFKNLQYGGFGFIPRQIKRFNHQSVICSIDRGLAHTPLGHFAGLAYVAANK